MTLSGNRLIRGIVFMILLTVQNLSKSFGGNEVLRDISFTLKTGMRMGLVGVNGCGKSTLLRILCGQEHEDGGTVSFMKGVRVGYLAQQGHVAPENSILKEMEDVFRPVVAMEEKLREMEQRMAHAEGDEALRLYEDYDRLQHRFEEAGGYEWKSRVQGVLLGLGFGRDTWEKDAKVLSGGELTRLCMGKLLLQQPDVLLLDEPTNHLDLSALAWLEKYLSDYKGTVLVVSHDRYFLNRVCTDITEILLGRSEQYAGNYDLYMQKRTERFDARMKAWELQQKEIARQEAIIERYKSFNREKSIRAARSKEKRLEKVERLERPGEDKQIGFSFSPLRRTGEDVLTVRNLSKSFGERCLFRNLDLPVRSGERVALVGPNGVGKSTLLNILTGRETADGGSVLWGANTDVGYYDQHQRGLHEDKSVLDEVWDRFPKLEQYQVRGALGLFLFTGEDVFEKIGTLSGGEKGRVALTELMLRHDNVLLLDEPTNHLDMDSREVLEDALEDFTGTIIAVSHDRYFINRFATRVAVLSAEGITLYNGNWDDYQDTLQRQMRSEEEEAFEGMTRTQQDKIKRQRRQDEENLRKLKQALKKAEQRVQEVETLLAKKEGEMSSPAVMGDAGKIRRLSGEYEQLQQQQAQAYADWEAAEQALEEAEA